MAIFKRKTQPPTVEDVLDALFPSLLQILNDRVSNLYEGRIAAVTPQREFYQELLALDATASALGIMFAFGDNPVGENCAQQLYERFEQHLVANNLARNMEEASMFLSGRVREYMTIRDEWVRKLNPANTPGYWVAKRFLQNFDTTDLDASLLLVLIMQFEGDIVETKKSFQELKAALS